jgi:hypothetical protein
LQSFLGRREGDEGQRWWGQTQLMYNVSIFTNITTNPPVQPTYANKNALWKKNLLLLRTDYKMINLLDIHKKKGIMQ